MGGGWKMAKELKPGDQLHGVRGGVTIDNIDPGPMSEARLERGREIALKESQNAAQRTLRIRRDHAIFSGMTLAVSHP